jgi:hypothetical protein
MVVSKLLCAGDLRTIVGGSGGRELLWEGVVVFVSGGHCEWWLVRVVVGASGGRCKWCSVRVVFGASYGRCELWSVRVVVDASDG